MPSPLAQPSSSGVANTRPKFQNNSSSSYRLPALTVLVVIVVYIWLNEEKPFMDGRNLITQTRARLRQVDHKEETDPRLVEWNAEYHNKRHVLRNYLRAPVLSTKTRGTNLPISVHFVYGGDCSWYTLWQSLGLEHTWMLYHGPSAVKRVKEDIADLKKHNARRKTAYSFLTRIVVGCDASDATREKQPWLAESEVTDPKYTDSSSKSAAAQPHSNPLVGQFFTPPFATLPSSFDPFNYPAALAYWVSHSDALLEDYLCMVDVDSILIRKFHFWHALPRGYASKEKRATTMFAQAADHFATDGLARSFLRDALDSAAWSGSDPDDDKNKKNSKKCAACPSAAQWQVHLAKSLPKNAATNNDTKAEHEQQKEKRDQTTAKHTPAIEFPIILSSDVALDFISRWSLIVQQMKQNVDDKTWQLEWQALSAAAVALGLRVEPLPALAVAHAKQRDVWVNATGMAGAQFIGPAQREPVFLHYGHRGVGWFEVGHKLESLSELRQLEERSGAPVMDRYHFSKFRVPSDWPGGKVGEWNVLSCEAPLLQEFGTACLRNVPRDMLERDTPQHERNARLLEMLLPRLNEALARWKAEKCLLGEGSPDALATGPQNLKFRHAKPNYHQLLRTLHPGYFISHFNVTTCAGEHGPTFTEVRTGK